MNKLNNNFRTSTWREGLLAAFSAILGILAGPIFETTVQPWFSPQNLPFATYSVVSILFLVGTAYSLAMWRATYKQIMNVANSTRILAEATGRKVQILSLEYRYIELQKRVQNSSFEIIMLTNYMYDWDKQKQGYDTNRVQSLKRKAYYETLHTKLNLAKGSGFRFVKIIQVPEGHKLAELFPHDRILKEDCEFLASISALEPEFASLRTSDVISQLTFTMFDRSSVVMYIEIRNPETGQVDSPFVIIIDDPNSESIQTFLKIFQRVEAKSKLIIDVKASI